MTRLYFLLASLLQIATALAQTPQHDLLRSLDKQRFAAQVQKDSVTLQHLLADDLIYTHSNGTVETKAQFTRNVLSGKWKYLAMETDSATVRFYGSTAILTGRATVTLLMDGKPTPVLMIYTDVWHQKAARTGKKSTWQLVSWAACRQPLP